MYIHVSTFCPGWTFWGPSMGSHPALQSGPALSPRTDVPWCCSQKEVSSQMSHDAILRRRFPHRCPMMLFSEGGFLTDAAWCCSQKRFPHRCPMMPFSEGGFLTDVPWCHFQKVSSQMSHDAILRRRFPHRCPMMLFSEGFLSFSLSILPSPTPP